MRRRRLVRLQLGILAAVLLLLIGRALFEGSSLDAAVALTELEPDELRHVAFVVEAQTTVIVEGAGSVERATPEAPVAAYGWITRRDAREPVWTMAPGRDRRGTLFRVTDTLTLAPGTYDAYFAGYGADLTARRGRSLLRRIVDPAQRWRGDYGAWQLLLRDANTEGRLRRLDGDAMRPSSDDVPGLIWASGPVRNNRRAEFVFEVVRSADISIYAVGEVGSDVNDYGWIEAVPTGTRVWAFEAEAGEPAGGAALNRRVRTTTTLRPGLYRAVFQTDGGHAFADWYANPPYDPYGWGLTVTSDADGAVRPFDPFEAREPIVALTRVPNDHLVAAQFVVQRPAQLLAYAVGEITRGGVYDHAWLADNATEQRVWEMDRDRTQHAGGDSKNRLEAAFLSLEPGTYTLYYQTDGSHAYGDWNTAPPEHPERWGVTLFPTSARLPAGTVEVLQERREHGREHEEMAAVAPSPPPPPISPSHVIVDRRRLGNDADERVPFELDAPTRVRIRATGELNLRGRYDWGGIERAGTGETVWEMTWQNTRPAGAADRNRLADEVITLEPGRYVAFFQTDLSHAYNDFGRDAPAEPEAWGIVLERLE